MESISFDEIQAYMGEGGSIDVPTPPTTGKQILREETAKMSGPQRFIAGVGGGMYGMGLGATQLGAELANKVGLVEDQTVTNLRQQGREHRDLITDLKMGKGGITNPASWGEFLGETAPTLLLGGLAARGVSKLPFIADMGSNALKYGISGMAGGMEGGAITGATSPLAPGESRIANTLLSTGVGGLGGTLLGSAGGTGKTLYDSFKVSTAPWAVKADHYLRKIAPYSPSTVKEYGGREKLLNDRATGIETIYRLRDQIDLPDETGTLVKGQLPKTQFEFLQSIHQAKSKLFDMYDSITQQAGNQGLRVPVTNIRNFLQAKVENLSGEYTRGEVQAARRLLSEFENDLTPRAAQTRITKMNEKLADYYSAKDPKVTDTARVEKETLDLFRRNLTETIEQAGDQYAPLRKAWGSVKTLESDAIRKFESNVNKKDKATPLDFLAAEQVLYAIAKGNPKYLIPATGTYAYKMAVKYLNNPDRLVKNMFRAADREFNGSTIQHPDLLRQYQRGATPATADAMFEQGSNQLGGPRRLSLPEESSAIPERGFVMKPYYGDYIPPDKTPIPPERRLQGPVIDAPVQGQIPYTGRTGAPPINAPWNPNLRTGGKASNVTTAPAVQDVAGFDFDSALQSLVDKGMSAVEARDHLIRMIQSELKRRK